MTDSFSQIKLNIKLYNIGTIVINEFKTYSLKYTIYYSTYV